jgi:phage shock protein A
MTNTNYPSATPHSQPPRNNTTRNIIIGVLAVGLIGTWAYLLLDKNKSNEKIAATQTTMTTAMTARDSVQDLYNDALSRLDSITGSNNNLQGQLSERQTDITKLKNEINSILKKRNATQAELTRAKSLISELNGKIANLEAEVTRLTGENQELTASNTQLTVEKQTLETNLSTTQTEKKVLEETVDVGSTFSASNIQIAAVNEKKSGKEKTTDNAKKVDKLVVSFDVENRIAKSGPADLYIMVTAPDGTVITDPSLGSATLTTRTDGDKMFTSKVAINYDQGTRKNIQLPLRQGDFLIGDYKIQIYQNGFKIGEGVRTLKKGGLFG